MSLTMPCTAVELMEKYCSVKATLEGSAKVTWSHKIIEE